MATVLPRAAGQFAGIGEGIQNFINTRDILQQRQQGQQQLKQQRNLQLQQQNAQRQDLVGLSQAIQQGQQGGNLLQFLGNFQPKTTQGAQAAFNLTSQLTQGQGDPFTLSPGQQRFGAGGQQIAAVAAAPKTETVGDIRVEKIRQLQEIPEAQRTTGQSETLKKLLEGVSPVNINLGKPASAAERTAIAETAASLDSLDNLETLFISAETETGPIIGRVSPAKGLLGLTSNDQEDFMAASSNFENKVIKDITGAQMSEKEATRILKQVPRITDPPARWKAKLKQTRKNLQLLQKRRAEVLAKSGLVAPELEDTAQQFQSQLQTGEILVRDKATGQIGALPKGEFNPNLFEKVN